ncbi:MAG: 50S ribosomal protein L17 [Candidatus Uhrbacteria bacterium GW2011_GWF2_41_16]|jgi:large subunit ribosomal protein L17|uniref:50S ribosomal protein L17 n=2 Tax=Candidatus Uhriibacteriota TaxID=1752732 RepID=A0A0G0V8F3_9BACT|nr:MAG: 50S ribosomal protein L17 [Candidatus Uhrbacteria bacterium GW2011_GWA2_41_10]KKR86087.1 MAG: 50S ribosomal protein L17 [Candidatus Uhrbacteria bacterium GW2011_GWC2_41_11]KKR97219.1 MAG: 50S ribosomal protein L17 [Candidatus Uhrbacteria bacterium GW2011_GWF2_41_16]HBP00430.1 50S ribosomal protein L17 [Candidatus Uhrbacteria bacterium]
MRHRNKNKILDRKKAPRTAMLKSLAESIILYEKVETTEAKAKFVRSLVERAITTGKIPSLQARRKLIAAFHTELPVKKILEVLGPRYLNRPGGYTRIIKLGTRQNDRASMVQIELV